MAKFFEVTLKERITCIISDSSDKSIDDIIDELIKTNPDDYKDKSHKDLKYIVTNVHRSVVKGIQKKPRISEAELLQTPPGGLKRLSIGASEPDPKRLKTDDALQTSDANFTNDVANSTNDIANSINNVENSTNNIVDSTNNVVNVANNVKKAKSKLKGLLNFGKDKSMKSYKVHHPTINMSVMEGISHNLEHIKRWMVGLDYEPIYFRGILISGPEGCGKTLLSMSIAGEKKYPIIPASISELFRGFSDDKEDNVKNLFAQAENLKPCFILIEGIDALTSKQGDSSSSGINQNSQNVTLLKECIQGIEATSKVFVMATARKFENVDTDLRQSDIFGLHFPLKLPDLSMRKNLLEKFSNESQLSSSTDDSDSQTFDSNLTVNEGDVKNVAQTSLKKVSVKYEVNFQTIAESTPGFSGRDLQALLNYSRITALEKYEKDNGSALSLGETPGISKTLEVIVKENDFNMALKQIIPTAMSKDVLSIPNISWSDIGALENIKQKLNWEILYQIKNPDLAMENSLLGPEGVMLFGPPGCGKTMIAKAMANEASFNFLYVKGPELMDKYVGESERNIRSLFQRAKECSPCLIFFDEIDSISEKRSSDVQGGAKVVQQLLTELDGAESRDGVYVMGATNRIDCVDPAFLRGNRFGTKLYVGLPCARGRLDILGCLAKKVPLGANINLQVIAEDERCENFNGADLTMLMRKSSIEALKQAGGGAMRVTMEHLQEVLSRMKPSVPRSELRKYELMAKEYENN